MPFLMLGEALVDLICEQPAEGIGDADWNPADPALRDALGAAAEAGARATESWGAVA